MFELNNIKYKQILNIDNLTLQANKITSILGESGSGKTTLLKLLNKLYSIDSGTIKYKGQNIENIDSISLRREVIMLSQSPILYDGNIKDNLIIGLEFSEKKIPNNEDLLEILKYVKLNKNLDDKVDKLSGGEAQRLALARVLLMSPKVLLLDEPSSALDDSTEDHIIQYIVNYIKKNNMTLILVTHSKSIASKYSDIIVTINNGSIDNVKENI